MSTILEAAASTTALTADHIHAIGVDAYIYFYPLILMDLTRKQSTNITEQRIWQRPDEYVCERSSLSAGGF